MTAPIPRDIPDLPPIPGHVVLPPTVVPARAVLIPARRRPVAAFRGLIALLALTGVAIELLAADIPPTTALSHFTIQSGILLALVMLASARCAWSAHHPLPGALTGAALFYVIAAALVHHVLLAHASSPFATPDGTGTGTGTAWQTAATHILHTAVPVAAALDWLLLTPAGRLHLRQAPAWLLYPLAYLAFTLARGELLLPGAQDRYLYPFLDVAQHGYKIVLGNALLVGLALYALAVLLVALDHIRPTPVRRPR
ncbi:MULTISPECIES: Pr6Pr family membrane protein [Streptomyces]|uniref:Integral membrane regulator n=1 Tax=Streptomyces coelicolor (strain ATCC BAA-471 / A3(2) / M145) TaxID=100226 RepID=Q9X936_STRCO|nr:MULTISPECIES: Pr6Pr family membrane protein [Streptomyces]MDX2924643.1 Pr6Pr family membrane protein [Streptomyces sp. NRRL_B-16638]MDX3408673.1 Pr6Pr family membrane protein [Streptomyces sp. ME02-6977A]MYU43106.1 integral membrane regulator [Streptomyces sp. SID7813]NSL79105.1 Pr6Pr family membrane protein [Streptomyces coelicolor]QFI43608.1 integral membrane regulator [Streptomyces coelicolor A3(2)]